MKKTTSEKLSNRLLKYSAFSAAILGTANASGQIVYTDIADETVLPGSSYYLDLNNDMLGDFSFTINSTANFAFMQPVSGTAATMYNSNGFVGFSSGPYNYPSNLASGDIINGTGGLFSARGDFNYSSCGYPGSQFCDGLDGYVGLVLVVGLNTHYGWARIQVASDTANMIIKDYAYNTTPDEVIEAGQPTLSVDDFSTNDIKVVALNKSIGLYNLSEATDYRLLDISGKSVIDGTTNGDSYVIEANSIANGIYIIELSDKNSNAVIRKKIVL